MENVVIANRRYLDASKVLLDEVSTSDPQQGPLQSKPASAVTDPLLMLLTLLVPWPPALDNSTHFRKNACTHACTLQALTLEAPTPSQIKVNKVLGFGSMGMVYFGILWDTRVGG